MHKYAVIFQHCLLPNEVNKPGAYAICLRYYSLLVSNLSTHQQNVLSFLLLLENNKLKKDNRDVAMMNLSLKFN